MTYEAVFLTDATTCDGYVGTHLIVRFEYRRRDGSLLCVNLHHNESDHWINLRREAVRKLRMAYKRFRVTNQEIDQIDAALQAITQEIERHEP